MGKLLNYEKNNHHRKALYHLDAALAVRYIFI